MQHYGADYGALDHDMAAGNSELDSELNRAAEAAALAIGWRQDGTDSSHSGAGSSSSSSSSEEDGHLSDAQQQDGVLSQRRVSWPNSQLPPLDPQSPVGAACLPCVWAVPSEVADSKQMCSSWT